MAQLAAGLILCTPGHFTSDEVGYDWAARAFGRGHGWAIDNGYGDFPTLELALVRAATLMPLDGHLVSKYPSLFPLLAAPLHPWLGFRSLCIVSALTNALALLGAWALGQRLLRSAWQAFAACLLLTCGTFVWQYSQSGLPHNAALAAEIWALYAALRSHEADSRAQRLRWAVLAGAILALGLGIRIDVLLFGGAIVGALLLMRPLRIAPAAIIGAGLALGLLLLSLDNYAKRGLFVPFHYNRGIDHVIDRALRFAPAAALMVVAVALRHALAGLSQIRHRGRWLAAAGIGIAVVLLIVPVTRKVAHELGQGTFALLVDLRWLTEAQLVPGVRTPHGSVTFAGVVKTALLQSCPWIALCVAALLSWKKRATVWLVVIPPAVLVLAYAKSGWHAGHCFNLRYFLPALPVASILAVATTRSLLRRAMRTTDVVAVAAGAALAVATWGAALTSTKRAAAIEALLGPIALGMALMLLVVTLVRALGPRGARKVVRRPLLALAALSMAWSVMVNLGYHYPEERQQRAVALRVAERVATIVPDESLVFADSLIPLARLPEWRRVWLAVPTQDDYADAWALIRHHWDRGHGVYTFLPPQHWNMLQQRAPHPFGVRRAGQVGAYLVFQLLPLDGGRGSPPVPGR